MQQRSQEWFEARKGKLTGSNIGAALGLNPYKTPDDLIRQMVREYHGAEPEFTGNIATEYGSHNEPIAAMDFTMKTGLDVDECGFFIHPEHEWLGASPDGLINENAIIEIKCPFGLRNKETPEFKTANEQPHYYAQVQIELACSGRVVCYFYQWAPKGDMIEIVNLDHEWLDENIKALNDFYLLYLSELKNPDHLAPKIAEINTLRANEMVKEYFEIAARIDNDTARKKELLDSLVEICDGNDSIVCGHKLTKVSRAGSVSYAKIVKDLKIKIDDKYVGKPTEYFVLK